MKKTTAFSQFCAGVEPIKIFLGFGFNKINFYRFRFENNYHTKLDVGSIFLRLLFFACFSLIFVSFSFSVPCFFKQILPKIWTGKIKENRTPLKFDRVDDRQK